MACKLEADWCLQGCSVNATRTRIGCVPEAPTQFTQFYGVSVLRWLPRRCLPLNTPLEPAVHLCEEAARHTRICIYSVCTHIYIYMYVCVYVHTHPYLISPTSLHAYIFPETNSSIVFDVFWVPCWPEAAGTCSSSSSTSS